LRPARREHDAQRPREAGYAARNPIDRLDDSHRPQTVKKEAAYFEDAELSKLRSELGGLHEVL
jgi:hypothetical protein